MFGPVFKVLELITHQVQLNICQSSASLSQCFRHQKISRSFRRWCVQALFRPKMYDTTLRWSPELATQIETATLVVLIC